MQVTTLIPVHDNQDRAFSQATLDKIYCLIADRFNGCSVQGTLIGWSIDEGKMRRDQSVRVTFQCENDQLDEAKSVVISIGMSLKQISMYFEVRDFDGVQFLKVPANEGDR